MPVQRWRASTPAGEQGAVLVLMAFLMVAMLGSAALAIDIGRLAITKRQLQNAADAGAFAGAQRLPTNRTLAEADARTWVQLNNVPLAEIVSVTVGRTNADNDTITVTTRRRVEYTFARVFNQFNRDVTASATVVVGSIRGTRGVPPSGSGGSSSSGLFPIGLLDRNGSSPGTGDTIGSEIGLTAAKQHYAPGNFGWLALDGPGGNVLRETLARGGAQTSFTIGDYTSPKPGHTVGGARQGFDEWAASHNDSMNSSCNNWSTAHRYVDGRLSISHQCRYRVVIIPIIDHWPNGNHDVQILGFAQMYITGYEEGGNGANAYKRINGVLLDDSWRSDRVVWGPADQYGTRLVRMRE